MPPIRALCQAPCKGGSKSSARKTELIESKLRDPEYLASHLVAVSVLNHANQFGWYDAQFLNSFEAAKKYLGNLLFFHYYAKGCKALAAPASWASHLEMPELGPLCDLIAARNANLVRQA